MGIDIKIIVVTAVLGLAIGILAFQRPLLRVNSARIRYGLLLPLAVLGAWMIHYYMAAIGEYISYRSWPTVEGVVVASEIRQTPDHLPQITYEYEVDGMHYRQTTNLETPMFGSRNQRYSTALEITDKYPVGRRVLVHYRADEPNISRISLAIRFDFFVKLALGAILLFVGIMVLTANGVARLRHHF